MGTDKTYVSLDERDLRTIIEAYAEEFYRAIDDEGLEHACRGDLRDIAKRLARFVKEYEALIEKQQEENVAQGV